MNASFPWLARLLPPLSWLLMMAGTLQAEPTPMMIGQGWAWVREFFPSSGTGEISRIVWSKPPPGLDLSSLQVWNVRRPWPMREWSWADAAPPPADHRDGRIVWRPGQAGLPSTPNRDSLEILLAQPSSHRMGHSITYRLPGLEWSAFYRLTVRGIGPQSIDAVQVDLTGTLRVLNHTDSTFSNAVISLVGVDPAMLPPPKPFGLLDLNPDSALSDLWLSFQGPSPLLPSVYPLRAPASLPSRGGTDLLFARVVRKPAHIVHVCDSDAIPAPSPPNGLPLIRVLHIDNTSANGLGFPLPHGKADLFLGSPRGAPVLSGHAVHTPFPGTLRLDMGKIDGVRAIRREEASDPLPEGGRQSDHSIRLINDLNSPVVVEVVEKPDVPGQWNLIRSSIPCTESSHSLRFSLTLRARSRQTVTYRLRQHAPHGSRGDSVPRQ